jgi:hypothetical protein
MVFDELLKLLAQKYLKTGGRIKVNFIPFGETNPDKVRVITRKLEKFYSEDEAKRIREIFREICKTKKRALFVLWG